MDKLNKLKVNRRGVITMGALFAGTLAVGVSPELITLANQNASDPKYPDQLGFIYDQQKCIGCRKCSTACKKTNNWDEGAKWRRVISSGRPEVFLSMSCNHCEKPVCVSVCPVKAYKKRTQDG
ncbi:MAG: 4Fe-4S dicluster domain-containing protein, partial [Syntrophomonas sp.]|nr:4Fe-4S dicluster domain-containing protein [Syntrophomonas sp.]